MNTPHCVTFEPSTSSLYYRTKIFNGEGDREDVPNVVLVLTDGESSDTEATILAARRLRDDGATILTVAIGHPDWMNEDELKGIASAPRDKNYKQVNTSSFCSIFAISKKIRRLFLNFCRILGYSKHIHC